MNTSPSTAPQNPTTETLRLYGDLLLAVQRSLTESDEFAPEALAIMPEEIGTGPLPFPGTEGEAVALWLDLRLHKLIIATSYGSRFELTLQNQSPSSFVDAVLNALVMLGVIVEIDTEPFTGRMPLVYDADDATNYQGTLGERTE